MQKNADDDRTGQDRTGPEARRLSLLAEGRPEKKNSSKYTRGIASIPISNPQVGLEMGRARHG